MSLVEPRITSAHSNLRAGGDRHDGLHLRGWRAWRPHAVDEQLPGRVRRDDAPQIGEMRLLVHGSPEDMVTKGLRADNADRIMIGRTNDVMRAPCRSSKPPYRSGRSGSRAGH